VHSRPDVTSTIQHQLYRLAFNLARYIAVDRPSLPPNGGDGRGGTKQSLQHLGFPPVGGKVPKHNAG